ncbi:hypothetical protein KQH40_00835 [bacterium]|nr:hypothetical protein [bacterium]
MNDQEHDFQQKLEELKRNNPLPIVAERYGVQLRRSGENFIGRCPFHPDRNPSFSIFLSENGEWAFFCHGASCGLGGDVFKFIGLMEVGSGYSGRREDFNAVMRKLGAQDFKHNAIRTCDELPKEAPKRPEIDHVVKEIWDVALSVAHELLKRQPRILAYLDARGFANETLARWRFGWWESPTGRISPVIGAMYAAGYKREQLIAARLLRKSTYADGYYEFFSGGKRFSGRIISADIDHAHRAAYLLARVLPWEDDGEVAKYLGPPDFAKPVLGIASLPRNNQPIALVEGFWNMLTLRKWGVPSIAVSGANLSPDQTAVILGLRSPIIPIRDMDEPNERGIIPGLEALKAWQKAIPGMPDGIALPKAVDGIKIKDINDLDMHPDGQRIFRSLGVKWGLNVGGKYG